MAIYTFFMKPSLLPAQVNHKSDRLLIVAADKDSLFDRWKPLSDFRIRTACADRYLILARRQILNDKLSPRITPRALRILRVLIRPERSDIAPTVGRQCPADDLHLSAKRQTAMKENNTNAGHLLPGGYFNPLTCRRSIALDSRNRKVVGP